MRLTFSGCLESGGAWQEWKPVQMQMNYDAAYLL